MHYLILLVLLLLPSVAAGAVKIKGSDIATNTITTSNLAFTPIVSTPALQGAGSQFYVSSGTVGTGGLTVLGELNLSGVVVSSHVRVTMSNGTLGDGDIFYSFVTKRPITITSVTGTILNPGGNPGQTTFSCGGNPTPTAGILTNWSMPVGTHVAFTESPIQINANTTVVCKMSGSTQLPTPTVLLELEYILR